MHQGCADIDRGEAALKELSWHRRYALQLAAQLPENYEDAMAVVRATERLVQEVSEGRPGQASGAGLQASRSLNVSRASVSGRQQKARLGDPSEAG